MVYQYLRLPTLESGIPWLALQKSLDMASAYFTINCKHHQNACGFMLIKLILEVRKAKIDWLQTRLAVNEILLIKKVISGKIVIIILEQR